MAARRAAAKGHPADASGPRLGFQPADLGSVSHPPKSATEAGRSSAQLPTAYRGGRGCTCELNRAPRRIPERREWAGIAIAFGPVVESIAASRCWMDVRRSESYQR